MVFTTLIGVVGVRGERAGGWGRGSRNRGGEGRALGKRESRAGSAALPAAPFFLLQP